MVEASTACGPHIFDRIAPPLVPSSMTSPTPAAGWSVVAQVPAKVARGRRGSLAYKQNSAFIKSLEAWRLARLALMPWLGEGNYVRHT